jgi:hypothetical protein
MKIKSLFIALVLTLSFMPSVAQANTRPVVESFTFTPNEIELIGANTTVIFELVVSHSSGIKNSNTQVNLFGPNGTTLTATLTRIDSPLNSTLTKVTFRGSSVIPQSVAAGAFTVTVDGVSNNPSAGYEYSTGSISPSRLRDLIGAESALLVRNSGDLNLNYDTFAGPTHNTTLGISYKNPSVYNNANPPIWKIGETYTPSKYYELNVPSLSLIVSSSTPTICSTDGKELKLIAAGNCAFKVSTAKTKDYILKESTQNITVTSARIKPDLVIGTIADQTSKNLPKTIEIFRVYSPSGVFILPKTTTPAVCIANGFYLQIVGGGTCTLTYQSEANTSYLASDIYKVSFAVTRDPQTMVFTLPATVDIGSKTLALAAVASSGASITYSTTTSEACSITGSILNLLKAGNCVVTASQPGTSTLAPISITSIIMLTGTVIAPVPVSTKKTIVCVKGKKNKKVSAAKPKCPKGFKIKAGS